MYRKDTDLEFLKNCSNEDLDMLVGYLTKGKNGNLRCTEMLTQNENYKKYYPNHKLYWRDIAAELQCFGGNTFATLFRKGKGVEYKEILIDVCSKLKVNFNKSSSVELIERYLLEKLIIESIEKMTAEDIKKVAEDLKLNLSEYSKEAIIFALQAGIKASGFLAYKIAVIVANAIAKQLIGRGLSLAANAGLTRSIAIFAGPIGWLATGIWTAVDIAGPAYRVTIPCVLHIAYMRIKMQEGSRLNKSNF